MNSHDVTVLDTLIATTIDSARGFEAAANDATDERLKPIFMGFASDRREVVLQLQAEVRRLGAEPESEGTLKATVHRRWMDLKNALTSGDEAVIDAVETGETYIRTKYEAALADDALSPMAREAITNAFVAVARGQARVIELRRSLGLAQRQSGRTGAGKAMPGLLGVAAVLGTAFMANRLMGTRAGNGQRRPARGLQVDEDAQLISSKKVEGTPVIGRGGKRLGTIDSFMVDKYSGRVAYAVMSHGGTLGVGGSLLPLPWALLTYDVDEGGYAIDMSADELNQAPRPARHCSGSAARATMISSSGSRPTRMSA